MESQKITNQAYADQEWFKVLASRITTELEIKVDATARQASKYRMRRGLIYTNKNRLVEVSA